MLINTFRIPPQRERCPLCDELERIGGDRARFRERETGRMMIIFMVPSSLVIVLLFFQYDTKERFASTMATTMPILRNVVQLASRSQVSTAQSLKCVDKGK
jgi:hypothetical protein